MISIGYEGSVVMVYMIPQFKVTDSADYGFTFRFCCCLSVQFFHERQGGGALKPFSRLMHAILIDAVRCYQMNFDACCLLKKQQFSEARGWLFHDEDSGPSRSERCATRWKSIRIMSAVVSLVGR